MLLSFWRFLIMQTRSLQKWFRHQATGLCELERITRGEESSSSSSISKQNPSTQHSCIMTHDVAKSIALSKKKPLIHLQNQFTLASNPNNTNPVQTTLHNQHKQNPSIDDGIQSFKQTDTDDDTPENSDGLDLDSPLTIAQMIATRKHFKQPTPGTYHVVALTNLTTSIHQIITVKKYAASLLAQQRNPPFDPDSIPQHLAYLESLWDLLIRDDPANTNDTPDDRNGRQRFTKRWNEVGFQGQDPVTDVRGGGAIAVRQVVTFVEKHVDEARRMLREPSEKPLARYPFACAGIGFSVLVMEALRDGLLDILLYGKEQRQADAVIDTFYAHVFMSFHQKYIEAKPNDVMDYPPVFKEFKDNFTPFTKQYVTQVVKREQGFIAYKPSKLFSSGTITRQSLSIDEKKID